MPDFILTIKSQVCQRGPRRNRVLNVLAIGFYLVVLGLLSLAGCEVQDPSHLKTAAETIQVPSLSELLFRPSVAVSVSACDTRTMTYA